MSETEKQASKKFSFFKYMAISLAVAGLAWLTSVIVFSSFVNINENLYAKTFIAWRAKGGDAAMFTGRYKGYKKNDFPRDYKVVRFLDIAQDTEALLLTGNYPLHAPREPEGLYTLTDDNAEDLWRIECSLKAKLDNEKDLEAYKQKAKDALKNETYDKEFKPKWFKENTAITANELKDIFAAGKSYWVPASQTFLKIIGNLIDGKSDYGFANGKVSDSFYEDVSEMLTHLEYDNISRKQIDEFFYNMATVNAKPQQTFIYSRLFNLWTFLTINNEFNYLNEVKKEDEKKTDEIHSKEKAMVFAQLFAKVYPKPYTFDLKELTLKEKMVKYFGTSQDVSKVKDQTENIKSAYEKANTNITMMGQAENMQN